MSAKLLDPHPIARQALALAVGLATIVSSLSGLSANEELAPNAAAVSVLKAVRSCFPASVQVAGILIPKNETAVRPERPGLKVAEVLAEPGQNVTAGQALARLTRPEGGTIQVSSPVAGLVSRSSAKIGAMASGKGEALFSIVTGNEFDLVGQVPSSDLAKLAVDQTAKVITIGAGEIDGKVRLIAPTVEPNSQLGQVFIAVDPSKHLLVNAFGRAIIKTGESCGIAVPLTAILYGNAGAVVQVVRRQRVETRHVEVGLLSGGQVEIREGLSEGDVVVARAGSLLREGDPVRPIAIEASAAH
ncbi:Secretion protein HlyD [Nitrobacter sp. Nb-311A]|uniref:efflux RND transporter periplasmic adaptor subunit n=1 Tax=unclassified Nitrobacter TaxID=2620411 RepID=UPI0000684ED7|nr:MULTISPECIES: HlyD family efflux transporter periplasmic adaptor subunit [unclassified Nitrobacter]EAQ34286.1 Secretion protein HlyD [Nitrobacter sp. Nb-311A]MCB1394136.1 HlyD family efflux transporter periplasmic adaptor subunit [Nitrobacter sp.]MCV0387355.1 HlyD family efflux transporter periplasmic adaptor subunit [Nitrobacter sp.]